ncbi:MAG TPA: glycosyltransferase [Solirubrobacteraceae bacterium]
MVDDGSRLRPFRPPLDLEGVELKVIRLAQNQGRSYARNVGLREAREAGADVTVFVDSDVIVPRDHITNLVQVMQPRDQAIAAGLFFAVQSLEADMLASALDGARSHHDWRSQCVYQPSWVGCPSDHEFVGRRFSLLAQTRGFRDWSGMVGPWCLANMVLGGCFAVSTELAAMVGGFDESFDRYGFTETTLVARLIAAGCAVIPVLRSTALHVELQPAHLPQSERNLCFRDAHRRFFTQFLAGQT